MKAVVQRVSKAGVSVDSKPVSKIDAGLLILLGVGTDDTSKDADYLVDKITNMRIFEDSDGKMNRSLKDTGGQMLVVSQFTLMADCRKGRRPSYIKAARPEAANELYEYFIGKTKQNGIQVQSGVFQAMMDVNLVNQGPVTILLDTKDR